MNYDAETNSPATAEKAPKIEYIDVKMEDGRTVSFTTKQKLRKTSEIDRVAGTVTTTFDFKDGTTRAFRVALDSPLVLEFVAHGIEQKLGDECSGTPDLDDAIQAYDELAAKLEAGQWSTREPGRNLAGASILCRALMELKGLSRKVVSEFLAKQTMAQKNALRANSQVAPIIRKIEAERAARSSKAPIPVDTDALLESL